VRDVQARTAHHGVGHGEGQLVRGLHRVVLAALVGLTVAACGTAAGPGSDGGLDDGSTSGSTPVPTSGGPGPADPLLLIGVWQVRGADEAPGTVLRVDVTELSLWRACGVLYGSWRADKDGTFVADAGQSVDDSCATARDTALTLRPDWLVAATSFRTDGGARMLLDDHGAVTAHLVPVNGAPPPDGSRSPFTDPPMVDAAARLAFAAPEPLPTGLRPATRATLVGRWVPQGTDTVQRPQVPFLRLNADGSWTTSDGCNGSMGRWTAGSDGRVLATSGASTLIGCHNVPVAQWWSTAARAGFDGPALVLLDRDGNELTRLTP
jgi:hypothetical protein